MRVKSGDHFGDIKPHNMKVVCLAFSYAGVEIEIWYGSDCVY
jgi:hypothetical protein